MYYFTVLDCIYPLYKKVPRMCEGVNVPVIVTVGRLIAMNRDYWINLLPKCIRAEKRSILH